MPCPPTSWSPGTPPPQPRTAAGHHHHLKCDHYYSEPDTNQLLYRKKINFSQRASNFFLPGEGRTQRRERKKCTWDDKFIKCDLSRGWLTTRRNQLGISMIKMTIVLLTQPQKLWKLFEMSSLQLWCWLIKMFDSSQNHWARGVWSRDKKKETFTLH